MANIRRRKKDKSELFCLGKDFSSLSVQKVAVIKAKTP